METYQQTEAYRLFVEKQKALKEKKNAASKNGHNNSSEHTNRDRQGSGSNDVEIGDLTNYSSSTFDIPIFTEEFLDHNKMRESELRQLRKLNTEYEEQNAILSKHIDNMKSAIEKLEIESVQQKNNNLALDEHLNRLKALIITNFSNIPIPGTEEIPTMNSIESYLNKLGSKLKSEKGVNKENDAILEKVQKVITQIEGSF